MVCELVAETPSKHLESLVFKRIKRNFVLQIKVGC